MLELAIDGVDREDRVLAHIRVTVFEAGSADGDEGFEDLYVFGDLLQESKGCTADVFVRVLLRWTSVSRTIGHA